jgi:O-antigen/teichoic acid export membrane protein
MENLNPYRKLGGQTLIYGLGSIIPRFLNYAILTPYYTYKFQVQEYGVITELYAYVAVLLVILTYGMETGFFKFASDKQKASQVFTTTAISLFTTSVLFVVFVFVFINKISALMGYYERPEYIKWMAIIIAADAFTAIFYAKIRMEEKVKKFAVFKIVGVLLNILFIMVFLEIIPFISRFSDSKWISVIYNKNIGVGYVLIANLISSIFICLLLLIDLKKIVLSFNFRVYKDILKYSFPLLLAGMAGILNETIDRILLRHFLISDYDKLYEIGIYGANYKIAVLMTIFIQMFRFAADPFFFSQYKKKGSNKIFANILKYFVIFSMIIFLFIVLYIDIIKYFISPRFHEGLDIVPVVLFANILLGILFNINFWYKLSGKTKYAVLIIGSGAVINILINVIFIPHYSYRACAFSHLISNFAMVVFSYLLGKKYYKIDYDIKKIIFYVLLGLSVYFVNILIKTEVLVYNIIIGTILFVPFVYFVEKKEKLITVFIKGYEDKNS